LVGFAVGVLVGTVVGGELGDVVGIVDGDGVVGEGVEIVGKSVGALVGPLVGTQCSKGSKLSSMSSKLEGTGGEANFFHV